VHTDPVEKKQFGRYRRT